jgi:hypothetical protein
VECSQHASDVECDSESDSNNVEEKTVKKRGECSVLYNIIHNLVEKKLYTNVRTRSVALISVLINRFCHSQFHSCLWPHLTEMKVYYTRK